MKILVPVNLGLTKRLKSRTIRIHGLPYLNQTNKEGKANQDTELRNALMNLRSRWTKWYRRERWVPFRRGESCRATARTAKNDVKTEVGRWVLQVWQWIPWFSLKLIAWRDNNLVGKGCFSFCFSYSIFVVFLFAGQRDSARPPLAVTKGGLLYTNLAFGYIWLLPNHAAHRLSLHVLPSSRILVYSSLFVLRTSGVRKHRKTDRTAAGLAASVCK